MNPSFRFGADGDRSLLVLSGNGERGFRRGWRRARDGNRNAVLAVLSATEHPTPRNPDRLGHRMRKDACSCRRNVIR
jgi:hypothetical protein